MHGARFMKTVAPLHPIYLYNLVFSMKLVANQDYLKLMHACIILGWNRPDGPLPKTERGNCYTITLVDYFSKWPEAEPI